MPLPDVVYLRHMVDSLRRLEKYVARTSEEEFYEDPIVQDGFIRHKLVHDYFTVDIDVVWATATIDAPDLRPSIETALASEEAKQG